MWAVNSLILKPCNNFFINSTFQITETKKRSNFLCSIISCLGKKSAKYKGGKKGRDSFSAGKGGGGGSGLGDNAIFMGFMSGVAVLGLMFLSQSSYKEITIVNSYDF